jgi:thiamine biosynthesis lipoprotein
MNRRDFLHPQHVARQAGSLSAALRDLTMSADTAARSEIPLLRATCRAMATKFEIILPFGTPRAQAIFEDVFAEIHRLESQLTVYSETSEVSRLNRWAPFAEVQVEAGLFELLRLSKEIWARTERAFDPSAGKLIKAWGFFRGPPRVPTHDEIASSLQTVGFEHIELVPESQAVRFDRPGVEINLGSIGKGYALDRASQLLRRRYGVRSGLLHAGRSSVYAIGTPPGSADGWPIAIRHPWLPDRQLGTIRLQDQALGTSAATYRHLEFEGRKLGHILDPRSGWPADKLASASAIAPSAAEGDALATAFFILGIEKVQRYCETHPEVAAILLPLDSSAHPAAIGVSLEEVSGCEV